MARSFMKGTYEPVNPSKYKGSRLPVYRSSWERDFMQVLDLSEGVLAWDSEPLQIPYRNPVSGRPTVYVPDFLVTLISNGKVVTKLIEIKPLSQTFESHAFNKNDTTVQLVNHAKWAAAMDWCSRRTGESGEPVVFQIMTEADMFAGGKAIPPTGKPVGSLRLPGQVAKKKMTPARPRRAKSITAVLTEKAKRAAGMHRTGKVSTRAPRVRRVAKVKRA